MFFRRINRNDPCWCGSGKKYKKCHMEQEQKLYEMKLRGIPVPGPEIIKKPEQIEGIRRAGQVSKTILDQLEPLIKPGVLTIEIDRFVHDQTITAGGVPATLNYKGFPRSCCTSVNEVVCHGIPQDYALKEGDIVNVDVTTIVDGFYGDISRMYFVGEPSPQARQLVEVTRECLNLGIEQVKPWNRTGDIGYAIEQHAKKFGYSVVRDYGGHGIGLGFHEDPFVPHYGGRNRGMVLVPNMVFTVEPMINAGDYRCRVLDDGWTAVTADGSLSAQWEHTVRVTETGVEVLTA